MITLGLSIPIWGICVSIILFGIFGAWLIDYLFGGGSYDFFTPMFSLLFFSGCLLLSLGIALGTYVF